MAGPEQCTREGRLQRGMNEEIVSRTKSPSHGDGMDAGGRGRSRASCARDTYTSMCCAPYVRLVVA